MIFTLTQYLLALDDSRGLTRTLGEIELCRNDRGEPCYSTGNSAAVFRIRHAGRVCALRCYFCPPRDLESRYPGRVLHDELYLYTDESHGRWVDVVLDEWIEGETLRTAIRRAGDDPTALRRLADAFDRMALDLLRAPWAHGDLKPDNLILTPEGRLRPIDFDTCFRPELAGRRSPGLGTAAFQHPARTAEDFDRHTDDFSIALISTALHALALDPALAGASPECDGLLLDARRILRPGYKIYDTVLQRFAEAGMADRYAIARLLRNPLPQLPGLCELLAYAVALPDARPDGEPPELFERDGRWGYRIGGRTCIPPIYEQGFDFSEGVAAVAAGGRWHYIDTAGHLVRNCADCTCIKPARNGCFRLRRGDKWEEEPFSVGILNKSPYICN